MFEKVSKDRSTLNCLSLHSFDLFHSLLYNSVDCVRLFSRSRVLFGPTPSSFCQTALEQRCWFATRTRASTSTPMAASPRTRCCSGGRCPPRSVSVSRRWHLPILDQWPEPESVMTDLGHGGLKTTMVLISCMCVCVCVSLSSLPSV